MELNGYSTLLREMDWPGSSAQRRVSPTGLRNDELSHHLAELRERLAGSGTAGPALPWVLDHLRHVQWHYTAISDEAGLAAHLRWAGQANAVVVVGDTVINPAGEVLVGPGAGAGDVPVLPEALTRAQRVRQELAAHDVMVPPGALPVRSTAEVTLRRPDQIAKRAVALVVSADFALSVLDGAPLDSEFMARTFPRSFAERTPTEVALFRTRDPAVAARLKWGYEAAAQLLAMCGRVEPTFPRDFADQGQVWNSSVGIEEPLLLRSLELLPVVEVCDAWEGARALHHTVSTARAEHLHPPAELDPDIVSQRYQAMEWLTGDQEWDEVVTEVPCTA